MSILSMHFLFVLDPISFWDRRIIGNIIKNSMLKINLLLVNSAKKLPPIEINGAKEEINIQFILSTRPI